MALTLRGDINRKLTIEEMDSNFTYLDNKQGGSAIKVQLSSSDVIGACYRGTASVPEIITPYMLLDSPGEGKIYNIDSAWVRVVNATQSFADSPEKTFILLYSSVDGLVGDMDIADSFPVYSIGGRLSLGTTQSLVDGFIDGFFLDRKTPIGILPDTPLWISFININFDTSPGAKELGNGELQLIINYSIVDFLYF